jgi:hypothetical protein
VEFLGAEGTQGRQCWGLTPDAPGYRFSGKCEQITFIQRAMDRKEVVNIKMTDQSR